MVSAYSSFDSIPNSKLIFKTADLFVAYLGDTFHHTNSPMPPLESFKPLKSMVFAGIYPLDPGGFTKLEEAIRRVSRSWFPPISVGMCTNTGAPNRR